MPLFRRKSEKAHSSSVSIYEPGRSQTPPCTGENQINRITSTPEENTQPFLAFAEATYDPTLPMQSQKSRLSKTLTEVLHDNAALAYFIQFMEFKRAKHLVKFWMEAESFRVSVLTRLRSLSNLGVTSPEHVQSLPPLLRSDSSGCVSDRSDDTTLQSSQHRNCNSNPVTTQNSHNSDYGDGSSHSSSAIIETVPGAVSQSVNSNTNLCNNASPGVHDSLSESASANFRGDCTDCVISDSKQPAEVVNCDTKVPKIGLVRLQTSIEQDAKSIYEKYIDTKAPFPIGVGEEIHNQIKSNIFEANGKIDSECFHQAQDFIVKQLDEGYFPSFLRSSFHCKHQIDVLTSGNVFLADVLYNDSALFYFMEFVEQESVRHLVDFLLMADNFQKHLSLLGTYDGMQAQNDAMIIYDKYFSLQATNPLGFSDTIRYEVEQNICQETGPKPDCFGKPAIILTQYIEKTYLLQFLSSQLYFKYISECIITIQNEGTSFGDHDKHCGSESGSEPSLPSRDSTHHSNSSSKVLRNIEDQDMRIDTGQFKPDTLWQRPHAGNLLMAHIDKLGRVVTEFEPEPDKRKESRISKAVKKLVNREDDKNQEDMAWQIAEMIVSDICSVTMPETFNHHDKF